MFTKRGGSPKAVTRHSPSETQLDLIASRDSHRDQSQDNLSRRDQQHEREIAPLVMNNTRNHSVSPPTDSPLDNNMDPFRDREPVKLGYTYPYSSGSQTYSTGRSDSGFTSFGAGTSFNGVQSSATTATDRRGGVRGDSQASMGTGRQPSLDALLTHSNGEYYDMPFFPAGASVSAHDYTPNPTYTATTSNMSYYLPQSRTPGPLVLHDPTSRSVDLSAEGSDGDTEGRAREFRHGSGERASEDIADLKRETLAISSPSPSSPNTSFTSPSSTTMRGPCHLSQHQDRGEEDDSRESRRWGIWYIEMLGECLWHLGLVQRFWNYHQDMKRSTGQKRKEEKGRIEREGGSRRREAVEKRGERT